ncbi:MAG: HpcH/HpaI aldolase family protein [Thermoleophilia bacterium]
MTASAFEGPSCKERLKKGDALTGTFVQTPHPVVCEFIGANFGLDFLCLEGEHSALGPETIHSMVVATGVTRTPALVRVANNDWALIAQALDAGAQGVIAPRINSSDEARALVRAALYPPRGDRGIGPGRVTRYGPNSGADYRRWANEHVLVAAQVETRRALDNLDAILAVDGLDMVFVGPMDLASSLGLVPNTPEADQVIEDILARAHAAGLTTGIFALGAAQAVRWRGLGVQLVILASDLMLMGNGLAAALAPLSPPTGSE